MTAPLTHDSSAAVPSVPVFNCVLHVAEPDAAGTIIARAANLSGIAGQGRTQREAIAAAASRGQGLIFTGPAGINDAGCRSLGYGLVVETTGASRAEPVDAREMVYVTFAPGPETRSFTPQANPGTCSFTERKCSITVTFASSSVTRSK